MAWRIGSASTGLRPISNIRRGVAGVNYPVEADVSSVLSSVLSFLQSRSAADAWAESVQEGVSGWQRSLLYQRSTASRLRHFTAIAEISIFKSRGNRAASKVARAGGLSVKYVP